MYHLFSDKQQVMLDMGFDSDSPYYALRRWRRARRSQSAIAIALLAYMLLNRTESKARSYAA
jgi:hypothetical protein